MEIWMADTTSILIVDDQPAVRALLTEILSPSFQCTTAGSAGEAIALIESQFFHLALVDVGLPGMSGIGLCRLLVKLSPGTSVVVVSGNTDDQSVADSMKAGAVDYIKKPFNIADVIATVERALGKHRPDAVA